MFIDFSASFFKKMIAMAVFIYEDLIRCLAMSSFVFVICYNFPEKFHFLEGVLPISVVGIALSIFLSFKSKAAYDRWWEARKIWGEIINDSRTFTIQILNYISKEYVKDESQEEIEKIKKTFLYRHIAWVNALRYYLRGEYKKFNQLQPFLSEKELKDAQSKTNKTSKLILQHTRQLEQVFQNDLVSSYHKIEIMQTLKRFHDHQGRCERIKNTPLPIYYNLFSKTFLSIFSILVPFEIFFLVANYSDQFGQAITWFSIPLATIISFMMYVIDDVGNITERPFDNAKTGIPISYLCRNIEITIKEMIDEGNIIPPKKAHKSMFGYFHK